MAKKTAPAKAKSQTKTAPKASAKAEVKPKVEKAPKELKAPKEPKPLKEPKAPKAPKVDKAVKAEEAKEAKIAKKAADKIAKAEAAAFKVASEDAAKWMDYKNKYGGSKPATYSMSGVFEVQTSIQHKVLGWGFIINIQNDRLEVVFEQGTKILISNYKPN